MTMSTKSVHEVYNTSYYITQKIHIHNKIKNNISLNMPIYLQEYKL